MQCVSDYSFYLFLMGLVLCAFAVSGLIYCAWRAREADLGAQLLEAVRGDWESAYLSIEATEHETALMTHRDPRVRLRWFNRLIRK